MQKQWYLATAVGIAMLTLSCAREQQIKNAQTELATAHDKLNYINEVLITDSSVHVEIPIDSNTAIVHANGDTTFPLWYRKQLAAVEGANGRKVGDLNNNGLVLQENDNLTAPARQKDGLGFDVTYIVPVAYKSVSFIQYYNGQIKSYMGTYNGPSNGSKFSYNFGYRTLMYAASTIDLEVDTYDASGNPVAFMNRRHLYIYGWQQLPGLGNSYGADMKVTNLDSDPRPEVVGVIAMRTTTFFNGISYKVFKNVDVNGNANGETGVTTRLPILTRIHPYVPTGASMAIADIDNNGKKDFVFVVYTSQDGPNDFDFHYVIGFDVNENGVPARWSDGFIVTGLNEHSLPNRVVDIGINILDVTGDGVKDMVLSGTWATGNNTVQTLYKVGKSLTTTGSATWTTGSNSFYFNTFPTTNVATVRGGGIAIGRITDKPGGGPLVMIANYYSTSGDPLLVNMASILDPATGGTASQNPFKTFTYPSLGPYCSGGGVDIADFDGNGTLDLINMAYCDNTFRFYVNYDMEMHYYNTTTYENYSIPYFMRGMNTGRN